MKARSTSVTASAPAAAAGGLLPAAAADAAVGERRRGATRPGEAAARAAGRQALVEALLPLDETTAGAPDRHGAAPSGWGRGAILLHPAAGRAAADGEVVSERIMVVTLHCD